MKFFKIVIVCSCMLTLISTMALAETKATTTGGAPLSLTSGTNKATPAFSFTPSPSTILSIITSETAFALTSASTKTDTENGIEYGVVSSQSPIYQLTQAAAGAVSPPESEISLGSEWKDKAGNTAP